MTEKGQCSRDPAGRQPSLIPPDRGADDKKDSRLAVLLLCCGLLFLLVTAAMVIWLLPAAGLKSGVTEKKLETITPPAGIKPAATVSAEDKIEAEELLGQWLKLQARAEAGNVALWGAASYQAVLAETVKADQLFQEGDFTKASAAYSKAVNDLEELLGSKEERLTALLTQGEQALAKLDVEAAAQSFILALAIDPENKQARNGAKRAENLDRVLLFYHKGLDAERDNELEEARSLLQQAAALDAEFVPAGEALIRVEERLRQSGFQVAMSRALSALAANDTAAARRALIEAGRLRPGDAGVIDAERRLASQERVEKLKQLNNEAEKLVSAERWSEALQVYDAALKVDPQFGYAKTGRKLAWHRAELDRSIKSILSQPDRLQEQGPLQEAEQILAAARSIEAPGPRLQQQITELAALLQAASTRVEVLLRSDNVTSVVIYRIGRLGEFLEKKVFLLPGTYVVVGSRPGFRDVRLTLKVQAEKNPIILDIRCEEPI